MKRTLAVAVRTILRAWLGSAAALALWSGWMDGSVAAERPAAATLKLYEVEPTVAGVLAILRQWQPNAENRARIARLVGELGDDNWAVRDAATRKLAAMGALAVPALREAADSRDAEVVIRVRKLLAERGHGRAEEVLSAALEWLRESPTPQATPLLLELLPVLPDTVQSAAAEALWACAGPDDVPRLRRAIGDARPDVRIAAILALEQAAADGAVRDLEPLLSDRNETTRLAAARAMLDRRRRPAIAALLSLLDARNSGVRLETAWLLQQVSGIPNAAEPLPNLPAAAVRWNAWAATEAAAHPHTLGPKRLKAGQYAQYPFVPGKLGNAVIFDGIGSYIDFGNPSDRHLDIGKNATIEAWVRFDALPAGTAPAIVGKNEGPGNQNKWVFAYAFRYCEGVANATIFHINSPSTGPIWVQSKPWTPVIGQWYHLAVVKRGNQYSFYRNGVADGTDSSRAAVPRVDFALLMGHSEVPAGPADNFRLQGALDDVRLWNTDLTRDQIHTRMSTELSGSEAKLVGYWKMDGSSGTTIADSTRYHVNGTYKGRVSGASPGTVR